MNYNSIVFVWMENISNLYIREKAYYKLNVTTTSKSMIHIDSQMKLNASKETQPFPIRYKSKNNISMNLDQKVKIREGFSFSVPTSFTKLKITLMRNHELCVEPNNNKKQKSEYIEIQSLQYQINSLKKGIVQYYQMFFSQPYYAAVEVLIVVIPIAIVMQQAISLFNLTRQVKQYRYNSFILNKYLSQCINKETILKIPKKYNKIKINCSDQIFKKQSYTESDETTSDQMQQIIVHESIFLQYLINFNFLNKTINELQYQVSSVMKQNKQIYAKFMENLQYLNLETFRLNYIKNKKNKFNDLIFRSNYSEISAKVQQKQMKKKIKKTKQLSEGVFCTHDETIIDLDNPYFKGKYPLILQDIQINDYRNQQQIKDKQKQIKIFVLAHGFQGKSSNLENWVKALKRMCPEGKYLKLHSYENNMSNSIQQMSKLVAIEIKNYIHNHNSNQKKLRIYMIGHSMGGIVLRGSLKHLQQYKSYLHTFISLAVPNLGYISGTKFLTGLGLSLSHKLFPCKCLQQISNKDHKNIEQTFIYQYSELCNFNAFKYIIFMSSIDDCYVPWHSARLQPYSYEQNKEQIIQQKMLDKIISLKQSNICRIDRIEVNFQFSQSNYVDNFIGRSAHIKFLSDSNFMQMVVTACINHIFQ